MNNKIDPPISQYDQATLELIKLIQSNKTVTVFNPEFGSWRYTERVGTEAPVEVVIISCLKDVDDPHKTVGAILAKPSAPGVQNAKGQKIWGRPDARP